MALVPFPHKAPPSVPDDDLLDRDDVDGLDDDAAGKMSFLDHLDELRKRIIWSVVSIFVGVIVAFFFINDIFNFIMKPLQAMLPPGGTLVYTEPSEAFMLNIKIALIAGLILASPAVFAQIWMFIAPGLYSHEKKWAIPFVVLSSLGFVGGAAFSHYFLFPAAWAFFGSFSNEFMQFTPRVEPVWDMYVKLALGMGLVFQMPVLMFVLARLGIVTAGFLAKNFKYAFLLIFIVAAIITPDGSPANQILVGAPMVVLYIVGIGVAWLFGKSKKPDQEA